MNNYNKYLKYKKKYLALKKMTGGGNNISDDTEITIQFKSDELKIPYKIVKESKTLVDLIEDSGIDNPLDLSSSNSINNRIFRLLIELLSKLNENPNLNLMSNFENFQDFIDLYNLINYLEITILFDKMHEIFSYI